MNHQLFEIAQGNGFVPRMPVIPVWSVVGEEGKDQPVPKPKKKAGKKPAAKTAVKKAPAKKAPAKKAVKKAATKKKTAPRKK